MTTKTKREGAGKPRLKSLYAFCAEHYACRTGLDYVAGRKFSRTLWNGASREDRRWFLVQTLGYSAYDELELFQGSCSCNLCVPFRGRTWDEYHEKNVFQPIVRALREAGVELDEGDL